LPLVILVIVTVKNTSLSGAFGWAGLKAGITQWVLMGILWMLMYISGGIFFVIFYLTLGFAGLTRLVRTYVAR
jgi:hypothetical protein